MSTTSQSTRIISRASWGARAGRGKALKGPLSEVVIHTEAGPDRQPGRNEGHWAGVVRGIESFHVNTNKWSGIAYSFLISPDGHVFEGRGWLRSGAHTEGRNSTAHAVCFLGNGDRSAATPQALAAARGLIAEGIRLGHIKRDYVLSGHFQYSKKKKTCPGLKIRQQFAELQASRVNGGSEQSKPEPKSQKRIAKETDMLLARRMGDGTIWLCTAAGLRVAVGAKELSALAQRYGDPIEASDDFIAAFEWQRAKQTA